MNFSATFLRALPKFGGKVQKIFSTQPFRLGKISYHFILFMNEIFRTTGILQLPSWSNVCRRTVYRSKGLEPISSLGLDDYFNFSFRLVLTINLFMAAVS
jgi:hypothetical protein